jgi:predicted  nucleic acid-binding Zn-ribbon protein
MADEITYELFTRRFDQLNDMHRELRADIRALGDSMLQLSRQISNLDRRISDVKDELEGTIKMEMGGAFAHLETRLEHLIERRLTETQSQFSED